jgi:hypothetical protein
MASEHKNAIGVAIEFAPIPTALVDSKHPCFETSPATDYAGRPDSFPGSTFDSAEFLNDGARR